MSELRAVAFDVGEVLIDETRIWSRWADRLGVPRLTFMGVLGGVAALGRSHRDAFQIIRPGIDVQAEMDSWAADEPHDLRNHFDANDLYPDVRRAFADLHDLGLQVIIAGNQPVEAGAALEAMDLGADAMLISDEIGIQKPDPAFFARVCEVAEAQPDQVIYVGDRVDNDVRPAAAAGMVAVHLRRGPWGYLQATWPDAAQAAYRVDDLTGVVDVARGLLDRRR